MADMLQTTFLKGISLKENCCTLFQILQKFIPKGLIDSKSVFVQVVAWHPYRWQAITWTNDDPVKRHLYASSGQHQWLWWWHILANIFQTQQHRDEILGETYHTNVNFVLPKAVCTLHFYIYIGVRTADFITRKFQLCYASVDSCSVHSCYYQGLLLQT